MDEAEEPALSSIGGLESPDDDDCWPRRLRRIDVIRNDWRNDWRARSTVENHTNRQDKREKETKRKCQRAKNQKKRKESNSK